MQQLGVRLWKEHRQERSEGNPELAFPGQRIPCSPPRKTTLPELQQPGRPGLGAAGLGRGSSGAEYSQNCSKWQHYKQTISLTYPGRLGQLRGGERALGRHKGTMEKLFQPEPTAGRRDSASGPTRRARLSSPAGASARPRFAAPSAAVAGAISKSFQEVSGPPLPASCLGADLPAAAPPAPPREPCRGAPGPAPAPLLCGCGAPGSAGWS